MQVPAFMASLQNMLGRRTSNSIATDILAGISELVQPDKKNTEQAQGLSGTPVNSSYSGCEPGIIGAMSYTGVDGDLSKGLVPTQYKYVSNEGMHKGYALGTLPIRINEDGTMTQLTLEDLDRHIDYSGLSKTMDRIIDNYALLPKSVFHEPDSAMDVADYLASTYAVLRQRIGEEFSGQEQKAELAQLDAYMEKQIDRFAAKFANVMAGAGIGVDDAGQMRASMKAAIYDQLEQYEAFIAENANYAGLEGPEEALFIRHTEYMSSHLRSGFASTGADASSGKADGSALCSREELAAISGLAEKCAQIWNSGDSRLGASMSEEQIGLLLGAMALKVDSVLRNSNAAEKFKAEALRSTQELMRKKLAEVDEQLSRSSNRTVFPSLDRSVIDGVINAIRGSYAATGSVVTAMQKGVQVAQTSYSERLAAYAALSSPRAQNIPLRYSGMSGFWGASSEKSGYFIYSQLSLQGLIHNTLTFFQDAGVLDVRV